MNEQKQQELEHMMEVLKNERTSAEGRMIALSIIEQFLHSGNYAYGPVTFRDVLLGLAETTRELLTALEQ